MERLDYRLVWTETTTARLQELCPNPLSNQQIADRLNHEFGTAFTRNAIIGKRARLGIAATAPKGAHTSHKPRVRRRGGFRRPSGENREIVVNHGNYFKIINGVVPPLPEMPETDLPAEFRCTLLELTAKSCRWPIGEPSEPDFCFCGIPTETRPYCEAHTMRAYTKRETANAS